MVEHFDNEEARSFSFAQLGQDMRWKIESLLQELNDRLGTWRAGI